MVVSLPKKYSPLLKILTGFNKSKIIFMSIGEMLEYNRKSLAFTLPIIVRRSLNNIKSLVLKWKKWIDIW